MEILIRLQILAHFGKVCNFAIILHNKSKLLIKNQFHFKPDFQSRFAFLKLNGLPLFS